MNQTVLLAVLAVLGIAVLGMLIGLVALSKRVGRLNNQLLLMQGPHGEEDFVTVVARQIEAMHHLDQHVSLIDERVAAMRNALAGAVQRVGVVRYDAFADMGGHLSFSAAFLDEHGNGIVLTCINGRTDARMYAKGVQNGVADDGNLSEEEVAAIRLAMQPGQQLYQVS